MCPPFGILLLLFVGCVHIGYDLEVEHTFRHKTEGMFKKGQNKQKTAELPLSSPAICQGNESIKSINVCM